MLLRVIDLETTGRTPSEIIEVGVVGVTWTSEGWMATPPRTKLYRPERPISVHTMAVHHLTDDAVADCELCTAIDLEEHVWGEQAPDYLVAHSAGFEGAHITQKVTGDLRWICTVKAARRAWPDAPGYSNQVLRYWRGLDLAPELSMPPHRAGPDAWMTAHLLVELLAHADPEQLHAWSAEPRRLDRVPMGRHKGRSWSEVPSDYLRWLLSEPDMATDVARRAQHELDGRTAP